jgi:hypothetical protein
MEMSTEQAKHTPGPWAFDGEGRIDALKFRKPSPHVIDGKEYMEGLIALPYSCGGSETHEANALLIAAAPELLEALKLYAEVYSEHWKPGMPILEPISDAAISKATGGTQA